MNTLPYFRKSVSDKRVPDERRLVSVNGLLGRELQEFRLFDLSDEFRRQVRPALGGYAYNQVYFETASGNVYRIRRNQEQLLLTDARGQQECAIAPFDIENEILRIGRHFIYGNRVTSKVTRIVAVMERYQPDLAKTASDIRTRFDALFAGGKAA